MGTRLLILNGPNLNLLGTREPEVYGHATLADIMADCVAHGETIGVAVHHDQANGEGALIDALHRARADDDGVVFNPGGYTHTSVALRDAIAAIGIPVVEVHLSNVHARESFRRRSLLAPVCLGTIAGLGAHGYRLAIDALAEHLRGGETPGQ
ncbi:MAG: type II 3-dehydroquinate dehydratase [Acidimicrobiales bacterium]